MENKTNKKRAGAMKKNRRPTTYTKKRQTKAMRQKKEKMYRRMNSALFSGVVST